MDISLGRLLSLAALYIGIIVSGVLLTRAGRPLNTALFTVHKLAAVTAVILLVVTAVKLNSAAALNTRELVIVIFAAVLFTGEIATGGLLSFDKFAIGMIKFIHRVIPVLILALAAVFFMLIKRNG